MKFNIVDKLLMYICTSCSLQDIRCYSFQPIKFRALQEQLFSYIHSRYYVRRPLSSGTNFSDVGARSSTKKPAILVQETNGRVIILTTLWCAQKRILKDRDNVELEGSDDKRSEEEEIVGQHLQEVHPEVVDLTDSDDEEEET